MPSSFANARPKCDVKWGSWSDIRHLGRLNVTVLFQVEQHLDFKAK